jgi:methylated-DNA-[protein]-cysteine S-methyltransferase
MTTYYTYTDSPLGRLLLTSDGTALTGMYMNEPPIPGDDWKEDAAAAPFAATKQQLTEYFAGTRTTFDIPLSTPGTAFQTKVWDELTRIPYGETISYGELARRIGDPKASRAVGLANGRNPISIIVPCHRVIGANGTLTGYAWGIERKRALVTFEATVAVHGPTTLPPVSGQTA